MNQSEFEELYEKYHIQIRKIINRFLSGISPADKEDVEQLVLIAISKLESTDNINNIGAFINGITAKKCKDYLRRFCKDKDYLVYPDDENTPELGGNDQTDNYNLKIAISSTLEKLSPEQKQVLVMQYIEGKRLKQISSTLGIPLNTVKSRSKNAREKFKEIYEEEN